MVSRGLISDPTWMLALFDAQLSNSARQTIKDTETLRESTAPTTQMGQSPRDHSAWNAQPLSKVCSLAIDIFWEQEKLTDFLLIKKISTPSTAEGHGRQIFDPVCTFSFGMVTDLRKEVCMGSITRQSDGASFPSRKIWNSSAYAHTVWLADILTGYENLYSP